MWTCPQWNSPSSSLFSARSSPLSIFSLFLILSVTVSTYSQKLFSCQCIIQFITVKRKRILVKKAFWESPSWHYKLFKNSSWLWAYTLFTTWLAKFAYVTKVSMKAEVFCHKTALGFPVYQSTNKVFCKLILFTLLKVLSNIQQREHKFQHTNSFYNSITLTTFLKHPFIFNSLQNK